MGYLFLDFETVCEFNIKKVGLSKYKESPTLKVNSMAYAKPEGPVYTVPRSSDGYVHLNPTLENALRTSKIVAWNADFEYAIIEKVFGLKLSEENFICMSALARVMGLPKSLNNCSKYLLDIEEAKGSGEILKKTMTPEQYAIHKYNPEVMHKLDTYCAQDVQTLRTLTKYIEYDPKEVISYQQTLAMNNNGIRIDTDLAVLCDAAYKEASKRANQTMSLITGGEVTTVGQIKRIKEYLPRLGVHTNSLDKQSTKELLARKDLHPNARQIIELRRDFGGTSPSKFATSLNSLSPDGTLKHSFMYAGADFGRWSAQGFQPQNMPALSFKSDEEVENFKQQLREGRTENLTSSDIAKAIRPLITAPEGKKLCWVDYSGIEFVIGLWLAGDMENLKFVQEGGDMYSQMANTFYGVNDVYKGDGTRRRDLGKTLVLALQYGAGRKALINQCAQVDIELSDQDSRKAIYSFHQVLKHHKKTWYADYNHLLYQKPRTLGNASYIYTTLPSGRKLYYWDPQIVNGMLTYKTHSVSKQKRVGPRIELYNKASIFQNRVQATARDLLANALNSVPSERLYFTIHDEVGVWVDEQYTAEDIVKTLTAKPPWLTCDIEVEATEGFRYRK